MLLNKKIVVVLPAYNAAKTLKRTYDELPHDIIDDVILIDDARWLIPLTQVSLDIVFKRSDRRREIAR